MPARSFTMEAGVRFFDRPRRREAAGFGLGDHLIIAAPAIATNESDQCRRFPRF
jgi:hypothetical protein